MVVFDNGPAQLYQGHVLDVLASLSERSVHCAITSPPFWSLRKYVGEQGVAWGDGTTFPLGLEPTVELYISHLVECFRAVRQVLRDGGTLWVELGDSMVGGGGTGGPSSKQDSNKGSCSGIPARLSSGLKPLDRCGVPERFALAMQSDGWWWRDTIIYHHVNCVPESVAGWRWERCRVKVKGQQKGASRPQVDGADDGRGRNPDASRLPAGNAQYIDCPGCPKCEANGGYVLRKWSWRTTKAHSYVFMFSKTASYFADGEDIREAAVVPPEKARRAGQRMYNGERREVSGWGEWAYANPAGRNLRSVWSIASQPMDTMLCAACDRMYSGAQYRRLPKTIQGKDIAIGFNIRVRDAKAGRGKPEEGYRASEEELENYPGPGKRICHCGESEFWISHYASFPASLVTPMILAGTSAKGVCPECGAPWARVVKHYPMPRTEIYDGGGKFQNADNHFSHKRLQMVLKAGRDAGLPHTETLGWRATCKHKGLEPAPATVLDPFSGTGTTGIVAIKLGRHYIGVDLSPEYNRIAARRLERTQPGMVLV